MLLRRIILLVEIVVFLKYRDFSVFFLLLDSLFGVDRRECDILLLGIKSEIRNLPIILVVIPLGPLMQLVEFILVEQNAHGFVAEFDCFLLASDDVEEFVFLGLVFLVYVLDLSLGSLVLSPQLLHDLSHTFHLLLQRCVIALNK